MSSSHDRLLLIGAGDLAREIVWAAAQIRPEARPWDLGGFVVSDAPDAPDQLLGGGTSLARVGDLDTYEPGPTDVFVCAIAEPRAKLGLTAALRARGARFANVVDPTAAVAPDATLGTGVYLARNVTVSVGARVGDDVSVNMHATIGHDVVLGDGSTVSSHCDLTGRVVVGRGAMFGSHAVVLPHGKVGDFAVVGAGTVVLRSVRAGTSVFGVPARAL